MARKKKGAANELPAGSVDMDTGKLTPGAAAELNDDDPLGVNAPAAGADVEVEVEPEDLKVGTPSRSRSQTKPDTYMDEAAAEDRDAAKRRHITDGIKVVGDLVARMQRGCAYAKLLDDADAQMAVLTEVGDSAAAVVHEARNAVRSAEQERRNLQGGGS